MATKIFQRIFLICFIIQIVKTTQFSQPPRAIQIITPENHSFRLNANALHAIFVNDNLKNRHLVVFSIAGPHRYGKSFIMNFFIRYLDAQVN